jgi:hypothetical protein
MVTDCFKEDTAFSQQGLVSRTCFTAGSREPDAYQIIKILLLIGEVKAGGDNQLPDKLTIFEPTRNLRLAFLALQNEEGRQ